jgi:nucleotide-binding universal stress UspA family protein
MRGPALLCYDGSDHAAQAISRAAALLSGRPAIVLHVEGRGRPTAVAEDGRRLALAGGFDPVSVVDGATGPVAKVILAQAKTRGVAAIVVGSRGLSASGSTILGSVSSRVAHHARHPLLVVRPGTDGDQFQGPGFVCYDGSDAARHAIATAGELLARRDAIVAYFLPAIDDGILLQSTLPWPASRATREALGALDRQEALHPVDVVAHGVALAERAGLQARSVSVGNEGLSGDDEEVAWVRLSEAAAAEYASCIVVGHRRSSGGLLHLDSTARGLVNHANRPVLVVPLS